MRKSKCFKGLITFMLAAVFAISFAFVGCNKTPPEPDDVISISSIQLDTKNAKVVYELNEDFNSDGLVVNLIKRNDTKGEYLDPIALDLSAVTVDSSKFQKGEVGEYTINVSYTEGFVTRRNSYLVTVKRSAGVMVEKTTVDYEFASTGTEVSVEDLTVQMAGVTGLRGEPLSSDKYTVSVYKDGTEPVSVEGGKFVATTAGAYQVWVKVENYAIPGDTAGVTGDYENFALVYVTDEVTSLEFIGDAPGTLTQQKRSVIDKISSTWKFNANFKSGVKKEISVGEEGLKISVDTNKVGDNGKGVATYEYVDCKGTTTSATENVAIIIEAPDTPPVEEKFTVQPVDDEVLSLTGVDSSDRQTLTQANLNTKAAFLTYLSGTFEYRPGQSDGCVEIKGDVLSVEIQGVGSITISARSNGTSAKSAIAIYEYNGDEDAARSYVAARFTTSATNPTVVKDDFDNIYMVTGNWNSLTFTILKPGRYVICTPGNVMINGTPEDTNRVTRIRSIAIVDERGGV